MNDLHSIQTFFARQAADWEGRIVGYLPQMERLVKELGLQPGQTVLDLGCGTGRAIPLLRQRVGQTGQVFGLDATAEMLEVARRLGRDEYGELLQGDVHHLPFSDGFADWVYAQGLLPHLHDPQQALKEMRRVTKIGGRLAIFHALGRVALAAVHQKTPSDDDLLAPARLRALLEGTGWQLETLDDAPERYLAVAIKAA